MKLFGPNQHDGDGPKATCLRHGLQALKSPSERAAFYREEDFANRSRILPSRWDRTQFVAAILACGQHYGKDGGGLL